MLEDWKYIALTGFLAGFCFVGMYITGPIDARVADTVAELVAEAESGAWASIDAMQISTISRQ